MVKRSTRKSDVAKQIRDFLHVHLKNEIPEFSEEDKALEEGARMFLDLSKNNPVIINNLVHETSDIFKNKKTSRSLQALIRWVDILTLDGDPTMILIEFCQDECIIRSIIDILAAWSTLCDQDGKKSSTMSKLGLVTHELADHVSFVLLSLASHPDSLIAMFHTIVSLNYFTVMSSMTSKAFPLTWSYPTQELLCDVFLRLIATARKQNLAPVMKELLQSLPKPIQNAVVVNKYRVNKVMKDIRPLINIVNNGNENLFSYELKGVDFIVNWTMHEHEVHLEGIDWLDIGRQKVSFGSVDKWISFSFVDIRRVHVEESSPPCILIVVERMPRNLQSVLKEVGAPEGPPVGFFPALRFQLTSSGTDQQDEIMMSEIESVFKKRLQDIEFINLKHRKASLPQTTIDSAWRSTVLPSEGAVYSDEHENPFPTPLFFHTPAIENKEMGSESKHHVSTRRSPMKAKKSSKKLNRKPTPYLDNKSTAINLNQTAKSNKDECKRQKATPPSKSSTRSKLRSKSTTKDSLSNLGVGIERKQDKQLKTKAEADMASSTSLYQFEVNDKSESVIDYNNDNSSIKKEQEPGSEESSTEELDMNDTIYTSTDFEAGEESFIIPSMRELGSPTGSDDGDLGEGNMTGLLMAQLMAANQARDAKKKHRKIKESINNATASIHTFLDEWAEFHQETLTESETSFSRQLQTLITQSESLQHDMDMELIRIKADMTSIASANSRLETQLRNILEDVKQRIQNYNKWEAATEKELSQQRKKVFENFKNSIKVTRQVEENRVQKNRRLVDALRML